MIMSIDYLRSLYIIIMCIARLWYYIYNREREAWYTTIGGGGENGWG